MEEKYNSCQSRRWNLGSSNKFSKVVLASQLISHGSSLNDDGLNILLVEVEAILDSRPLTAKTVAECKVKLEF